ncbi:MAG: ATP-binding protein [Cyanobacteria bacterium J06635_1]
MKSNTIPRLNLAPKRRKPLSLSNPLDYLQLLGWIFFFPQALRWYVETFGEEKALNTCKTWQERWEWWRASPIQISFWFQGLFLTIVIPLIIALFLNSLGISVSLFELGLGVVGGVSVGIVGGIWLGITFSVTASVAFGIALFVASSVASFMLGVFTFGEGVTFGVVSGVVFGIAGSVIGVSFRVVSIVFVVASIFIGIAFIIAFVFTGMVLGVALGFTLGVAFVVASDVAFGIAFIIAFVVAGGIAVSRPEIWAIVTLLRSLSICRLNFFSRVTPIPSALLSNQLSSWLFQDWNIAIHNLNELLSYTQQFIPIVNATKLVLDQLPSDLLFLRTAQLADNTFDWDLILYISASLSNKLKAEAIDGIFYLPDVWKQRLKSSFDTHPRLDTPTRAIAAGFWYLYQDKPNKAVRAFSKVQHLPHGTEMQQLASYLAIAAEIEQLNDKKLTTASSVPDSPLLRTYTWAVIARLRSVVNNAQIIYQSYSRSARSLALNRALGELTNLLKESDHIPQAERGLIIKIAEAWREKLLAIATDVGDVTHIEPVQNPYVAGDPVEGNLFTGRKDILQQLEELWLMGNQLQSVVLYGHRRMGKTSILKNLSHTLGNNLQVAYVNLLNLGAVSQGVGEVLITISDAISHTLSISPPKDEDLLDLPYPTFRRFIQAISKQLKDKQGLIIALDEFEKIEDLIAAGKLSPDFLGFLRGLLQMSPNIAFAFAGLHTLEEMTADYFNPLFASVLPIRIGFFDIGETRELLANPSDDFTLDYTPDTLNEIYRLTAGQPYLTQLIGFQLVRQYNHQVFEQGRNREPIFTPEDLTAVIQHTDFFAKGRYYFTGVWNQAAQDAHGQQALLKILAPDPDGLSLSEIRRKLGELSPEVIEQALNTLQRHDVVKLDTAESDTGKWHIIVPLFRQWVMENQGPTG